MRTIEKNKMKKVCEFQHKVMLKHKVIQSLTDEEQATMLQILKNMYATGFEEGRLSMRREIIREFRNRR